MLDSPYKDVIRNCTLAGMPPSEIRKVIQNKLSRQRISQIQKELLRDTNVKKSFERGKKLFQETEVNEQIGKLSGLALSGFTISKAAAEIGKSVKYVRELAAKSGIVFAKTTVKDFYKTGDKVNGWEILKPNHVKKTYSSGKSAIVKRYDAKCKYCGKKYIVTEQNLKNGSSKSCFKCAHALR